MRIIDCEGQEHDSLVSVIANRQDCSFRKEWNGEVIDAALSFETTKRLETAAYVQFLPNTSPNAQDHLICTLRRHYIDHVWVYVYPHHYK